tara:strand:+ start:3165 stop:3347 length:183 start_codon:yes stop_codon:yes gene_type:complete
MTTSNKSKRLFILDNIIMVRVDSRKCLGGGYVYYYAPITGKNGNDGSRIEDTFNEAREIL